MVKVLDILLQVLRDPALGSIVAVASIVVTLWLARHPQPSQHLLPSPTSKKNRDFGITHNAGLQIHI